MLNVHLKIQMKFHYQETWWKQEYSTKYLEKNSESRFFLFKKTRLR